MYILQSAQYGYKPPSGRLAYGDWDATPHPYNSLTTDTFLHSTISKTTRTRLTKIINSRKMYSSFDDIYNRIHVTPHEQSVGTIVATKDIKITVWNACFDEHTLNSILKENADGITIAAVEPYIFKKLESIVYDVTVTVNGPPAINARYVFNFDIYPVESYIVGKRLVAFMFVPLRDFSEELQFSTDILKSWDGEQRIALRKAPRELITYNYTKTSQISLLRTLLREWVHRTWGVPIWFEAEPVSDIVAGAKVIYCDTSNASFMQGGYAFLWENDSKNEILEISAVYTDRIELTNPVANNYTKAYVMPMKSGIMSNGVQFKRSGNDSVSFSATFIIIGDVDYAENSFPVYSNYPVLDTRVIVGNMDEVLRRPVELIDNGQGLIVVEQVSNKIYNKRTIGTVAKGKDEVWQWKKMLHYLKGRQKAFWLPSFSKDIKIKNTITAGSTGANIEYIGLSNFGTFPIATRLQLRNGTVLYFKITYATKVEDGEVISLDTAPTQDITADDIVMWSFMDLVRLDADSIKLEYKNRVMKCNIPVVEVAA